MNFAISIRNFIKTCMLKQFYKFIIKIKTQANQLVFELSLLNTKCL